MDIIKRLKKSYTCRNQHTDDNRTKTTDTCVDSQAMCMCEYEDRQEAAAEIERLREALTAIEGWYPTDVSRPHDQIKEMRTVAKLALTGDFRQYVEEHYAALEVGEL